MAQVINTNVSALNAQRNLSKSQSSMQTSLQRLSSGLRINSAKDDSAGLAISDRFMSQINGLTQASRNANDGISLAQTAEGALDEVTNGLQRMRTLAVQAANDTNSDSDRQSIQVEIEQIVSEINRIGGTTQFNGKNLLDGSNASFNFQIGANASQSLTVKMSDMRASALGQQPGAVQTVSHRVDFATADAAGNIGVGDLTAGIGGASGTAITEGDFKISIADGAQNVDIAIARYGGDIVQHSSGNLTDSTNINYGGGVAKDIAARINSIRNLHEVDSTGKVVLEGVYASAKTEFNIGDIAGADVSSASGTAGLPGVQQAHVGQGHIDDGALKINGVSVGAVDMQVNDAGGNLVNAINSKSNLTGVKASIDNDGRLNLTAEDGRDIILETKDSTTTNLIFNGGGDSVNGAAASGHDYSAGLKLRVTGQVTYSSQGTMTQTGNDLAGAGVSSGAVTTSVGKNLKTNVQAKGSIQNADVTTVAGANTLIKSVDSAIKQVDSFRAVLGATQNRFEMTIRNLDNVSENLSAANSRIRDADFAMETSNMTRNQILQQAGISILSQANAQSQNVMSLLR